MPDERGRRRPCVHRCHTSAGVLVFAPPRGRFSVLEDKTPADLGGPTEPGAGQLAIWKALK